MFVSQAVSQTETQEIELQTIEARAEPGNGEGEDGVEEKEVEEGGEEGGREKNVGSGNDGDKQEKEVRSEEEGMGEGERLEGGGGEESGITSDVVRKFQQQLEEIKVAPRYNNMYMYMIYGCSQPRELWFIDFNHVHVFLLSLV